MYIYKAGIEKKVFLNYLENNITNNNIDASYILETINTIKEKDIQIEKVTITFNENKCGIPYDTITSKLLKKINLFSLINKTKIYYIIINNNKIIIFGKSKKNIKAISIIKNYIIELEKDYSKKDRKLNK